MPKDKNFGLFLEIEHKFVIPHDFDVDAFSAQVKALGPERVSDVRQVKDTYYVSSVQKNCVYRHRYDDELQHLTVKQSKVAYTDGENKDNEIRQEINILLSQQKGDQEDAVQLFLQTFDAKPIGCLYKDIRVFYFPDCEICLYKASLKDAKKTPLHCIEFEAKEFASEQEALDILFRYEKKLGFDARQREKRNLFELFFSDDLAT